LEVSKTRTIFPATAQDRMNYLIGLLSADQQIAMVLSFSSRLDTQILKRALQLTLKLVPILNCRFVAEENPYWESTNGVQGEILVCENCTGEEREKKVNEFIVEPGDRINGPLVQAKLLRAQKDTLIVKISHLCSDATGLKEYIQLLASVYTAFSHGSAPKVIAAEFLARQKPGFREQSGLFSALGIKDLTSLLREDESAKYLWRFPSDPAANDKPKVAIRRLKGEQMTRLINRAKAYGATVNDLICAAYFRSLLDKSVFMEPCNEEKAAICITVDLRRYLPGRTTGTICNLSGSEAVIIELQEGEEFEVTLAKVKQKLDTIKNNRPGLSSAAMMELIAGSPLSAAREEVYKQKASLAKGMNTVLPYLSNLGIIAGQPLKFGSAVAEDGYMTGPINYAPFFYMGVSTYNEVLTLAVGYHTPAISEKEVNRLLDVMVRELSGG